jgi:hypothetical protein
MEEMLYKDYINERIFNKIMSNTIITQQEIEQYLYKFLKSNRAVFKNSCRLFKKYLIETKNNEYIFKYRRDLSRLKRIRTKNLEVSKLSKFIKKFIIGNNIYYDGYFLTDFFKNSMIKRDLESFEWLSDKTPLYSLELLITNIINTKQLLNEYEKGILFTKDKDKNTFRNYFKNIDNLTNTQKEKLIKYAILENRQELLSYIKNENIINSLNIQKEYNHLDNISLIPNKQKIIRSFKYYLHNLFNDKSLVKNDVAKKRNVDKLFRDIIEHYFDTDRNFIEYYSLDDREDYKKLKKVRQSHEKQSFNFHDIKFSNFS